MKEENIHDELQPLSPLLSDLKGKKDPHLVPDDYFKQLESSVFARLEAEGLRVEVAPAPWQVWLSPMRLSAVAAAIALLVAAVWWFRPQADAPAVADTFDTETFTPEMAEEYVQDNILDFEEDLLTSNLEDLEIETEDTPIHTPQNKLKKTPVSEDDLDRILDDLTEDELEDLL